MGESYIMSAVYFTTELLMMVKNVLCAFLVAWVRFFVSPSRKDIEGEVVLVTGAGNGMGRELSVQISALGATVVLWDTDREGLERTKTLIQDGGGQAFSYVCDVGDPIQVDECGDRVKHDVGEVTVLINNAGVVSGKSCLDLTRDDVMNTFNTNLLGVVWVTKKFLPSMIENNQGHIVNMASSCGLIGLAQLSDYSASKSGVIGFTEVLNYEMTFGGYDGVHTTLVCPSYVKTDMFQGCHSESPWLVPELELSATVSRIVEAMLTNQTHLFMPRLVYVMAALKTLMPTQALTEFIRFTKAHQFMTSFVGRHGGKGDNSSSSNGTQQQSPSTLSTSSSNEIEKKES